MKKILPFILLFAVKSICAQEVVPNTDIGGFQALAAEKLKEAKPVGILSLNAKPKIAAVLPVWTFHDDRAVQNDYVEIVIGGIWQTEDKPYPFLGVGFNIVALSARAWDWQWARDHVKRTKFPPIFIGPAAGLPIDIKRIREWTWQDQCGIQAGVRF